MQMATGLYGNVPLDPRLTQGTIKDMLVLAGYRQMCAVGHMLEHPSEESIHSAMRAVAVTQGFIDKYASDRGNGQGNQYPKTV